MRTLLKGVLWTTDMLCVKIILKDWNLLYMISFLQDLFCLLIRHYAYEVIV